MRRTVDEPKMLAFTTAKARSATDQSRWFDGDREVREPSCSSMSEDARLGPVERLKV